MEFDSVIAGLGRLAHIPRLKRYEEKRAVGGLDSAEQAVSQHRADVLDARRIHDDFLNLPCRFGGTLQRRSVGQLQPSEHVSLVLVGQEAARNFGSEEVRADAENAQKNEG